MRSSILPLVVILTFFAHRTCAQTNLIAQIPDIKNSFFSLALCENEHSIYIIRQYSGNRTSNLVYGADKMMLIQQLDKQTNTVIRSVRIWGDTVQKDSIYLPSSLYLTVQDSLFYLICTKGILVDSNLPVAQRYKWAINFQVLDTALNTIIPERRLLVNSNTGRYRGPHSLNAIKLTSRVMIGYWLEDTVAVGATQSRYMVLTLNGDFIRDTVVSYGSGQIEEMFRTDTDKVCFTGLYLSPPGSAVPAFFTGVNTDITTGAFDTINFQGYSGQQVITHGYFPSGFNTVALPSGGWIGARPYSHDGGNGLSYTHTAFIKMKKDAYDKPDTLLLFAGADTLDNFHAEYPAYNALAYNPTDQRIYYVGATHADGSQGCAGSYNYLQVMSADTNLRHSWRKFIKSSPNYCMMPGSIAACVGRSGVLVSGMQYLTSNPVDTNGYTPFVYRIDSGSNLGVGHPTAPVTIRNRIAAYPNPLTDYLTIDDIFGHLATATLTNMQGQLVYQKNISGNKVVIPIKDYPPGLYLLRVKTTDGEPYSEKIVIQ